jgi:hypothetical protein
VADLLRQEPDTQVELIDGANGEFTVLVDGREVASKGVGLPDPEEVVKAVRGEREPVTS